MKQTVLWMLVVVAAVVATAILILRPLETNATERSQTRVVSVCKYLSGPKRCPMV